MAHENVAGGIPVRPFLLAADLGHTRPAKSFATDSNPIPHSPAATFDIVKVVICRIHNDRAARLAGGVLNFCPAECGIDLGRMHRGGRATGEAHYCNGENTVSQDAMTQSAHGKRLSLRRGEIKKGECVVARGFWPLAQSEAMSAFGDKADITLRLCTIGFLFRRRRSGRFAPADCFPGTILVSIPDASNDNVGDHTHDRGNDQRHQELAHGCGPLITEQRKPVLCVSLRGCRGPIGRMSAIGTKRTSPSALHMSAFDRKRTSDRRTPALRHRPRRVGSAWVAEEAQGHLSRLIV